MKYEWIRQQQTAASAYNNNNGSKWNWENILWVQRMMCTHSHINKYAINSLMNKSVLPFSAGRASGWTKLRKDCIRAQRKREKNRQILLELKEASDTLGKKQFYGMSASVQNGYIGKTNKKDWKDPKISSHAIFKNAYSSLRYWKNVARLPYECRRRWSRIQQQQQNLMLNHFSHFWH